jgi:RNA polymerase sigma-70 factor (ECF subfamily)
VKVETITDEALMEEFRGGSTRAFERLLKRHRRPMFNFIHRQVGSESLAEDLFQEVFLRIVKAAPSYRQEAKFTTWMYRIARNLCIDHARRSKHRRAASLDQEMENGDGHRGRMVDRVADEKPGTDRRAMGRQLQGQLARAVDSLSEEQREVFLMREFLNLRFREIAEIVSCSENTVKSRMRYALEHLRRELAEYRDMAKAAR